MALPRIHRLPRGEIRTVIRQGSQSSHNLLTLRYIRRDSERAASRFAVIVSKQAEKRSHGRNVLRRRINGWLFENLARIPASIDGVIILHRGASRLSRKTLYSSLENLFKKAL